MNIHYSQAGCVSLTMPEYIDGMVREIPLSLLKGTSTTPAASHLFNTNPNTPLLSTIDAVTYHHLVAKLLYLTKCTCTVLSLSLPCVFKHLTRMVSRNLVDADDTFKTPNTLH